MKEKEKVVHLLILVVYTVFELILTIESKLMNWENGPILLLFIGLIVCWALYITEKIPPSIQLWLVYTLTMLSFFYYGSHETSMYDMAPFMIMVIILYSVTEKPCFIWLSVGVYCCTMLYDFLYVVQTPMSMDELTISRTLFHFALVFAAGYLTRASLERQNREKSAMNKLIGDLEENNRRTEDFLTNVSHELRTPINVVTGITAVMLKSEDEPDKRKDILSVQKAGRRLFEQIEDILDYTEIDTGRIRLIEESYMISSVVNDLITGNQMMEREHAPELIFDVDPRIPSMLLGDAKKIKKILKHLIDNAFKFTKQGGIYVKIHVLKKEYGVNLCIQVRDTGTGIAKEELGKIKDHFYQASGGRNRKAGGLGLGLSIVSGLVNAMEGFLKIESVVDHGTTVTVSIPQKVVVQTPGMSLEHKELLCVGCFLVPQKHPIPEVRGFYNEALSHMAEGLDLRLHRVADPEELEQLFAKYKLTHLIIGQREFREYEAMLEPRKSEMEILVLAEDAPFFAMPFVQKFNAMSQGEEPAMEKYITCPGVRVLVVDDEPMNLMVAEGIFKDYRMDVTTAESGKEAIELFAKQDFDIIFLDHMMPEMDGVETIKHLRKISSDTGRGIVVIAFTANAVSGAREMFFEAGFDEFISKPVELSELERVLRKVLPKSAVVYGQRERKPEAKREASTPTQPTEPKQSPAAQDTSAQSPAAQDATAQSIASQSIASQNAASQSPAAQSAEKGDLPEGELWRALQEVGLNVRNGLQYSQGDAEFYQKLLRTYEESGENKEKELGRLLQEKDYKNYRIQVHALKSTSRLIGAEELFELAKDLEAAATREDGPYLEANHGAVMEKYREFLTSLRRIMMPEECAQEDCTAISGEEFLELLEELTRALKVYEIDGAEVTVSKLEKVSCDGKSGRQLIRDIKKDVNDFEFEGALQKVEQLIKEWKGEE